jgi:hypothetical protein
MRLEVNPPPTEQELAAIVAVVQTVVLPAMTRSPKAPARPIDDQPSRWRFAGRWWSKPVPLDRARP